MIPTMTNIKGITHGAAAMTIIVTNLSVVSDVAYAVVLPTTSMKFLNIGIIIPSAISVTKNDVILLIYTSNR